MIGITLGDYNSLAPRLILEFSLRDNSQDWFLIGGNSILEFYRKLWDYPVKIRLISEKNLSEKLFRNPGEVFVLDLEESSLEMQPGIPTFSSGKFAWVCLNKSSELLKNNLMSGVVTLPICKTAMKEAGFPFPGHTEFFADCFQEENFQMQFLSDDWIVGLSTIHLSLHNAIHLLDEEKILQDLFLLSDTLKRLSPDNTKIIVCGLNPHAGEEGLFGKEEIDFIIPAIEKARTAGLIIDGPVSPDTAFLRANETNTRGILALYHDQGLIPFKLRHFHDGVNYTANLPYIRTSVDHGTGYDKIACKKISILSLEKAIQYCRKLIVS